MYRYTWQSSQCNLSSSLSILTLCSWQGDGNTCWGSNIVSSHWLLTHPALHQQGEHRVGQHRHRGLQHQPFIIRMFINSVQNNKVVRKTILIIASTSSELKIRLCWWIPSILRPQGLNCEVQTLPAKYSVTRCSNKANFNGQCGKIKIWVPPQIFSEYQNIHIEEWKNVKIIGTDPWQ